MSKLDSFTRAYIECALWSSTDDSDQPLDANYGIADLAPETLSRIVADCAKFQRDHAELLTDASYPTANAPHWDPDSMWDVDEKAGHDFWLTRNGHGAGFWDGDWAEPAATVLTDASKAYGECDLYVGDDGLVYC